MALSLTVDEIMKQAGPMIIEQPQKTQSSLSTLSNQPQPHSANKFAIIVNSTQC